MSTPTVAFDTNRVVSGLTYQKVVTARSTRYWIIVGHDDQGTPFVSLPDFGRSATMAWEHYVHPSYAAEKLGLGEADAEAVAAALNGWKV